MFFFSRLLDCKKIPLSYLYLGVLEQGDVQEGGFQRIVYGEYIRDVVSTFGLVRFNPLRCDLSVSGALICYDRVARSSKIKLRI